MRTALLFLFLTSLPLYSQPPLSFMELGGDPADCRLFPFQSGNGLVWASATGGTPDYTYEWKGPLHEASPMTSNNTTWGGLNPGCYEITVTDAMAEVLIDTVCIDSIVPVADFTVTSTDLSPYSDGWYGFGYPVAHFINLSTGFANPNNPFADTTFWWNFKNPDLWYLTDDYWEPLYYGYPEGTYEVELVARNKNGCTDSTMKTISVFGPLTVGEFTGSGLFIVTPDFNSQQLRFNTGGLDEASIRIYDSSGRLVHDSSVADDQMILFEHPRGIYIYEVSSPDLKERLSGKFNY